MRYMGKEFTGRGVTIAIVDSGIDISHPALAGVEIAGLSITMGSTRNALLGADFHDENGHGTKIAIAVHRLAPDAKLLAVKIMGDRLRTTADLMAAGIEISASQGARVINLSLGTPNMGKALLLRDTSANAVEQGAIVLAAAHPKGERAYPADLPETVGVSSHPDCPLDKVFYFNPNRFSRKEWGVLSDKFLAHGYSAGPDGRRGKYRGSGLATAHLSGMTACLVQALADKSAPEIIKVLQRTALVPIPEIGYA
ncbi:MAG: S8 family serine peptidase [Deltaproteobacteria bacterium]|nr:S8 family serine peptidase [Deltaproteobacteria bacterium]